MAVLALNQWEMGGVMKDLLLSFGWTALGGHSVCFSEVPAGWSPPITYSNSYRVVFSFLTQSSQIFSPALWDHFLNKLPASKEWSQALLSGGLK